MVLNLKKTYRNPVIKGFYPDPSACKVDSDYYLVTSSFSYFPGIPVFHSRDLVNWEQLGHVIDRPEQMPLGPGSFAGGLFAPTIRYHAGLFYVIVQNASMGDTVSGTNFIFTATDPAGPWSQPVVVEGGGGDPSLFWDDDGKCYIHYSNLQMAEQGVDDLGIYLAEIDPVTGKILSEPVYLWKGALENAYSPEAPHIYKINGYYYLMIAEGGTEHFHGVTIARSESLFGPYECYLGNPILTHHHLSKMYPICNVGHAELLETDSGAWYMVVLASRLVGGYHKNLGRETFLVPVIWEEGWPIASPETGRVEWEYPFPNLAEQPYPVRSNIDDFNKPELDFCWNLIGCPTNRPYRIADSMLYIRMTAEPICPEMPPFGGPPAPGRDRPAYESKALGYVARRQEDPSFIVEAKLHAEVCETKNTAGLCMMQNNFTQIRLELSDSPRGAVLRVVKETTDNPFAPYNTEILGEIPAAEQDYVLKIYAREQDFSFYAIDMSGNTMTVAEHIYGGFMGSESAGGYLGTYIGMFASGNGTESDCEAAFDWFSYSEA